MNDICVTRFVKEACPMDYSASVAEIGNNAGASTWQAAMDDSADYLMLGTPELIEDFKNHVRGYGAWEDAEIDGWDDLETNALFIQFLSGAIREYGLGNPADEDDYSPLYTDRNGEVWFQL